MINVYELLAGKNTVIEIENDYISYNPSRFINTQGQPETAVVIKGRFYIFYGDLLDKFKTVKSRSELIKKTLELYDSGKYETGFSTNDFEELRK